jgi:hypothetical protein
MRGFLYDLVQVDNLSAVETGDRCGHEKKSTKIGQRQSGFNRSGFARQSPADVDP